MVIITNYAPIYKRKSSLGYVDKLQYHGKLVHGPLTLVETTVSINNPEGHRHDGLQPFI